MQKDILLDATLKEKVSSKGKNYYVIEIEVKPGFFINCFPEPAELEVIKMYYNLDNNANDSYLS